MSSSNPVISQLNGSQPSRETYRPLTLDDVIVKTSIALAVIVTVASAVYALGVYMAPAIALFAGLVGAIVGFIVVLVWSFKPHLHTSATATLLYALFEGMFVGGVSYIFTAGSEGGSAALVGQAVVATVVVFAAMLFVYKQEIIKVTEKFTKVLMTSLLALLGMIVVNFITALVFGFNLLRDGGPIAVVFSIVCIVIAALTLLVDFQEVEDLVDAGADSRQAWGVALGLCVSIVWIYIEILRLLSYKR